MYNCKICKNINIKLKHNMIAHLNSIKHINEVRKIENFKNIKNLTRDDNTDLIMCKICENIFKTEQNLDKHMDIHNKKYIQYKCENCDIILSTKSNYNRHIKENCKENATENLKTKSNDTIKITTKKSLIKIDKKDKNNKNTTIIPMIKQIFDENFKKLETNLEYKIKESIDNSALNTKVTTAINTAAALIKYLMKQK